MAINWDNIDVEDIATNVSNAASIVTDLVFGKKETEDDVKRILYYLESAKVDLEIVIDEIKDGVHG